ncbi:hypothetical protein [Nostoc sp.]|uniref:hypothetical protein n=1 Tax=Nostoc sp. TaxID=1180 RepID=UPI002FFAD427
MEITNQQIKNRFRISNMLPVTISKGNQGQSAAIEINGTTETVTYLTDLKAGKAIAILTDKGNWYLLGVEIQQNNQFPQRNIEYRKTDKKIMQKPKAVFLLTDRDPPKKTVDESPSFNHFHVAFSLGAYSENIRIKFVQFSYGFPESGDINSKFTIDYPDGSYSGEFREIVYGGDREDGYGGYYQTPILYCSNSNNIKTIDIRYDFTFTNGSVNFPARSYIATAVIFQILMPSFITDGIKKTKIFNIETEYTYFTNSSTIRQSSGGGLPLNFLFTKDKKIFARFIQSAITHDSLPNIELIPESINTSIADKKLSILTDPYVFKGGQFFSYLQDESLFLTKKAISINLSGNLDENYNLLPHARKKSRVSIPANQEIYNLSQTSDINAIVF